MLITYFSGQKAIPLPFFALARMQTPRKREKSRENAILKTPRHAYQYSFQADEYRGIG